MFDQNEITDRDQLIQYAKDMIHLIDENTAKKMNDVKQDLEVLKSMDHVDLVNAIKAEDEYERELWQIGADSINNELVHLKDYIQDDAKFAQEALTYATEPLNHLVSDATEYYGDKLRQVLEDANSSVSTGLQTVEEFVNGEAGNIIPNSVSQDVKTIETNAPIYDPIKENERLVQEEYARTTALREQNYAKEERTRELHVDPINESAVNQENLISSDGAIHTINPADHFRGNITDPDYEYTGTTHEAIRSTTIGMEGEYQHTIKDHFAFEPGDESSKLDSEGYRKFTGSSSPLYTNREIRRKRISERGLPFDEVQTFGGEERALSPIDAFFRLDNPTDARYANIFAYNRTRLPSANIEWRKGFRHVFITRPECFIYGAGNQLSEQCVNDEIFYTAYTRMPHILYLLSPSYITCPNTSHIFYGDNFNYLLSNRLTTFTPQGIELTTVQSEQKSNIGSTVIPGSWIENDFSSTLSLNFRETKHLEVYECLRLWIRYINKTYSGEFAPSYSANYDPHNSYGTYFPASATTDTGATTPIGSMRHLHPYDRALDYCATIFDIVTNESGTKILYWCKYIGVYPTSASLDSLSDNANSAITSEQTCSAKFIYQGKEEYTNRALVEFNYNAGIVDELGNPYKTNRTFSLPFLLRDSYTGSPNSRDNSYMGAVGMYTGRPYVVLKSERSLMPGADPSSAVRPTTVGPNSVLVPQLRFAQLQDLRANLMNSGLSNDVTEGTDSVPFEARVAMYAG